VVKIIKWKDAEICKCHFFLILEGRTARNKLRLGRTHVEMQGDLVSNKDIVNKKCTLLIAESFFFLLVAFIIKINGPENLSKLTVPK